MPYTMYYTEHGLYLKTLSYNTIMHETGYINKYIFIREPGCTTGMHRWREMSNNVWIAVETAVVGVRYIS